MKKWHYLSMIFLISSCEKQAVDVPPNTSPIRMNFVSGCLKSAQNAQNAQIICECVYDTSEKLYGDAKQWAETAAQFNDKEIHDEKLKIFLQQSLKQCQK